MARALADDHVLLMRLHPFVRQRVADPGGAEQLRHRRLRPPRHQRADARQRPAGDRLLERHLRVLAPWTADLLPGPRPSGLRGGARLLLRLSVGGPGAGLRDDRGAGGLPPGRPVRYAHAWRPSGTPISTSRTGMPQNDSSTRSCCLRWAGPTERLRAHNPGDRPGPPARPTVRDPADGPGPG